MRRRLVVILLTGTVVVGGGLGVAQLTADAGSRPSTPKGPPPTLPWVRADGSVDEAKRAATVMNVSNSDGSLRRDANGVPVTVRLGDLDRVPPPPGGSPVDPPGVKRSSKDGVETIELPASELKRP